MYVGFAPGGVDAGVRVSSVFEDLATADEDDVVACELPGVASEDLRRGSQFEGIDGQGFAVEKAGAESEVGSGGHEDVGESEVIGCVGGEGRVDDVNVEAGIVFCEFDCYECEGGF